MDPVIIAALIAIIPASVAAIASLRTNRKIKTNHGKDIGQHVEALVEWAGEMSEWAEHHTEQDASQMADIRLAVGLPPRPYLSRSINRP